MKLLIGAFALLISFWSTPAEPLTAEKTVDFSGLWINVDQKEPGITKCKIHYEDHRYVVQMWGACEPADCDWGETASAEINREVNKFELLWNKVTFAESAITYEMVDGKLKVTNKRHFKDSSGRPDYTLIEYFIRQ